MIDPAVVDRAVRGQSATISPMEFEIVVWRLSSERGWGLGRISQHTGYSRARVAAVLAEQRKRRTR